jgi:ketosteroid isomerase-like protein
LGENAKIARHSLDVFVRQSFEEAQRLCSAEVEMRTLFDDPGGAPEFAGREGLRLWFERLHELWAFIEVQEVEIEERDGDWVLMRVSARVRGRGSPHELEPRISVAIQVTDGLISRFGLFPQESDAVAMIDGE